jgi:hypothetical protein
MQLFENNTKPYSKVNMAQIEKQAIQTVEVARKNPYIAVTPRTQDTAHHT